jgi:hypothetical protein
MICELPTWPDLVSVGWSAYIQAIAVIVARLLIGLYRQANFARHGIVHGIARRKFKVTNDEIIEAASAIAQAGSSDYAIHAGATLTKMSEQARLGQLEAMSNTLLAHVALHPADRRSVVARVPAMVFNGYLCRQGYGTQAVERWREQTPDWADTLKRAVSDPVRFERVAYTMADEIGRAETAR